MLIFENRSGAYIEVCEQRITENQQFAAGLVELSTDPRGRMLILPLASANLFRAPHITWEAIPAEKSAGMAGPR